MAKDLARTLIASLRDAGVDRLFGMPGGGPNLEKIGAGAASGMEFVLAHGETAACIMASTYGLLTGRPGVCLVTRGPGFTSAVNGLAQATLDRFPLLLVSDTVPSAHARRVPHQRVAQVEVSRPVTKWSGTLGRERPADVVRAAVELAVGPPAGAVHLDFDPTAPGDPPPSPWPATAPGAAAQEQARALLAASRRPVLLLGAEAIPWTAQIRSVVQAWGAPAFTTYQAKGIVPDSWPQAAGLFTNGACERTLVEQADLIVAVGLDPVEPIPAEWCYSAPVIALHPWTVEDPYFEPAVAVPGPIGTSLAALGAPDGGTTWAPSAGRDAKDDVLGALGATGAGPGVTPHEVVAALLRVAPPAVQVTVDAGAHFLVAMPFWPVEDPRDLLISNGLATMGFAVPAAIGAALARPHRPVLCIVGDGGLGMTLAELETVARLDLDVTVVVFNDAALSLIEIKQGPGHGGATAVRYRPADFAAVARGLGLPAAAVGDAGELQRELSGGWPRGPRLIDARVDPSVYGHVLKVTRG